MTKELLIKEVREIWADCSQEYWDGYRANPVTEESFNSAARFVNALPEDIVLPEPCPEGDGQIGFEWYQAKIQTLAVSVHSNDLIYAGIFLDGSLHGIVPFDGKEIPETLLKQIRRFTSP